MAKPLSRKEALYLGAVSVYMNDKIAADQKLDLAPIIRASTDHQKVKLALDTACVGKLAKDADISDVIEMLDQLESMADQTGDPEPVEDEDDTDAMDEDETDEEKAAREKKEKEDAAKDKKAARDKAAKAAMDAAIGEAVTAATKATAARLNEVREAEQIVRPYIGELAIPQETAADVYRLALDSLSVDVKGVHPSALKHILLAQPKPGQQHHETPKVAMDAAGVSDYAKRYPRAATVRHI